MNKKLLALLLAILMVAMSAVAMAQNNGGDVQDPPKSYQDAGNEVTISKQYKLVGAGTSPAETFDFSITPDNASNPTITISDPVFSAGAAGLGTEENPVGTASITLTLPDVTNVVPGEYTYTISEAASRNQGVTTISDNTVTLKLTVVTNENGTKSRIISLKQNETKNNGLLTGNQYTANTITIDKVVEGLMGNRNEEFDVTVVLTAETGKTLSPDLITVPDGATKTTTENSSVVTITGIKVSHNGTDPVISNVPFGTTYTVTENLSTDQQAVYTTPAYQYDDSTTATSGTKTAAAQKVTITNTAKTTEIDTGVSTDTMPYILLMAFVAILAVAFVAKKRSVNE